MKPKDWYLRVMVTLLVIGVWVLILKPVLAPTPSEAAAAWKVVRAQRFEVVDEEGKVRALLALLGDGNPVLILKDAQGKNRGTFLVDSRGRPNLALFDAQGKIRAGLWTLDDGSPSLDLSDAQGKKRLALGAAKVDNTRTGTVEKRPESSLVLFDKEGKVMWKAPP